MVWLPNISILCSFCDFIARNPFNCDLDCLPGSTEAWPYVAGGYQRESLHARRCVEKQHCTSQTSTGMAGNTGQGPFQNVRFLSY